MKPRILVVDDEAAVRESLKMILEYDGYDCRLAPSGRDGVAQVETDNPDLVFLDVKMPGMDGIEALRRIRGLDPAPAVVMISGHATVGRRSRRPGSARSTSWRSRSPPSASRSPSGTRSTSSACGPRTAGCGAPRRRSAK